MTGVTGHVKYWFEWAVASSTADPSSHLLLHVHFFFCDEFPFSRAQNFDHLLQTKTFLERVVALGPDEMRLVIDWG